MLRKLIIALAIAIAVALLAVSSVRSPGAAGPPPLFLAASQRALFPWLDLDQARQHCLVPAMDTIEVADRQRKWSVARLRQAAKDAHDCL